MNCSAAGANCNGKFFGHVTSMRMSRTPDQRVYGSGSYDAYSFGNCYVSLGAPDGEDFAFTKCDAEGKFEFNNIPSGDLRVTVFDQWNDLLVDGLSTPIKSATSGRERAMRVAWKFPSRSGARISTVASSSIRTGTVFRRRRSRACPWCRTTSGIAMAATWVQQHRSRRQRGIQRSLSVPELAGGRYRQRALQADGCARRL